MMSSEKMEVTGDTPLTLSEVRIQKPRRPVCRSLGVGRKRGGQPGNRNRLSHGGFSAKARERQASIRKLIAATHALITRVEMVARARCALKNKYARDTLKAAQRRLQAREAAADVKTGRIMSRKTGSVDSRSKPLEFVLDAKLLLLESGDPAFVPIGMGHFIFDEFLQFLMLFGELLNMPLKSHARTSQLEPPQLDHYRALVSRPSSAYALCNVNQ